MISISIKLMNLTLILCFGLALFVPSLVVSQNNLDYQAFELVNRMPYPRSDMTASVFTPYDDDSEHKIYLIGGCKTSQTCGPASWDPQQTECRCTNVTNHCSSFVPETQTWGKCANAPTERFRHMVGEVGSAIYVFGGRNVNDNIVKNVEMYDTTSDQWSTITTWYNAVSDAASFSHEGKVYIVGGYSLEYSSVETLTRYDPVSNTFDRLTSMPTDRGDVHAAQLENGIYAVIGGFADSNWDIPLSIVESYDVNSDTWSRLPSLTHARGDMATGSLTIGMSIFAIGGETKADGMSVPVSKVERFNNSFAKWEDEEDIPSNLFRFTGASVSSGEKAIYLFGGQGIYDEQTKSYPLSDGVYKYVPKVESSGSGNQSNLSDGGIAGITVAAVVTFLFIILGALTYTVHTKYSGYYSELKSTTKSAEMEP